MRFLGNYAKAASTTEANFSILRQQNQNRHMHSQALVITNVVRNYSILQYARNHVFRTRQGSFTKL